MEKRLSFVFDIDGTICPIKKKDEKYEDLIPYSDVVERIRGYRDSGARIILFTSRNMNSYHGNLGLINANTAKVLLEWLEKWNIPYDRSVRPREFMEHSPEELSEICKRDQWEDPK